MTNANAVADAILARTVPGVQSRGFANEFINEHFPGIVPPWTQSADDTAGTASAGTDSARADVHDGKETVI